MGVVECRGNQKAYRGKNLQDAGEGHEVVGKGEAGRDDGDQPLATRGVKMCAGRQYEHRRKADGQ